MSKFLSKKLSNLKPYVPGEQPKDRKFIKLNTNESPFQPSPLATKLASEQAAKLMLYPDPDCNELLSAIANEYGVDKEQVILSNGSDEVLNFAFMAYCDKDVPAVFADITYGFYKVFAEINCVPYKIIPLEDDFSINIEKYIEEKGTIFIANPNAPTGIPITLEQIEKILISNLNRIVVIDEAYVDFGWETAISLVDKYDNLLVTQTFSKSRSMAGARLGFGIASKEIINDLNRIKYSTNPYNVNRMTAAAGLGAIIDKSYFNKNLNEIIQTRDFVANELKRLGFYMTKSYANFLFVKHDKIGGLELYSRLRENGILVRHFNDERISEYNRITVGSRQEMEQLVDAIKNILEKE